MKLDTFAKTAPTFFDAGVALEIVSGPGVGKSAVHRQVAADMSVRTGKPFALVTHILSQMDPMDVRGYLFPIKNKEDQTRLETRFTEPSIFPNLANIEVWENGQHVAKPRGVPEQGILFLDEFRQCDIDMQKLAAQLILERQIGEFKLPAGWVVWAAGNRMQDKSGVVKRLSFLQNRLMTIEIQPDYPVWERWAHKEGVHPLGIAFAKRYPSQVFRESVPKEDGPYCTPRSLVLCVKTLMAMRRSEHGVERLPDDEIAMEVVSGWLGEGTAVEFMSHIRLGNELPEVEAVVKRPETTKVPERPDAQFVMSAMLAHHTTQKNARNMMTYMRRMDVEMQVSFVAAVTQRAPQVILIPEINEWISDKQDLLVAANG